MHHNTNDQLRLAKATGKQMRFLKDNFRTCYTYQGGYDALLAYQNAHSFWSKNMGTRPREKSLYSEISLLKGGNYGRIVPGFRNDIFDHIESWRFRDKRGAVFTISHPYLPPDKIHRAIESQPLMDGLDYRVFESKYDWYIPGVTSLVIVGRPDVLNQLAYPWEEDLPGSDPESEYFHIIEQAQEVILDTLFDAMNNPSVYKNKNGGVGETILLGTVQRELEPGFWGSPYDCAIAILRQKCLVVQVMGEGLFYAPSIVAYKLRRGEDLK